MSLRGLWSSWRCRHAWSLRGEAEAGLLYVVCLLCGRRSAGVQVHQPRPPR